MTDDDPPVAPATVIVPTRNRPTMLEGVVASLVSGDVVPAEILIVDQSDHPDATPLLPTPPSGCTIRHLRTAEVGLSRSNNLGARSATNDILLFTHDDVLVDRKWAGTLAEAVSEADPRRVITGRVAATEPEVPGGFAPALRDQHQAVSHSGRVGHDVLKPMNLGMHRTVFEDIGGFDERLGPGTAFPGAEDADLGYRLLEAGYRIDFLPTAVVWHRAWRGEADYLPLRWAYGISHGAFYAKHLHWQDLHMLRRMGRDVGRRTRAFPGRLKREGRRAVGDPLFIVANVVGAWRWWRSAGRS